MTTPTKKIARAPRSPLSPLSTGQRGIALVMVMIAIAITLVVTNEFGTSTTVDMTAAANYRDEMRAHFLARSATNLAMLVISLQARVDNIKGGIQITDFADQILLAFCGTPEEVKAAVGFNTDAAKGLGADIGSCGIQGGIRTDDDKIDINCANSTSYAATLKQELDSLMYFPAYDTVFDDPDAENYRRDRATQSAAIMDYIDSDTLILNERGTSENYGYDSLKDPYFAKNNYIDSVGEMKLIRGVDDRFWALFGSAFTAYGSCKVNLSAISNTQLIAAILFLSAKNINDPVLLNPQKLFALAGLVSKARQFGETFTTVGDFISFVKDPSASVMGVASSGQGTAQGSAAGAAVAAGIPGLTSGGDKLGLELDPVKLGKIAGAGPRRTYRVEAWGEIERKQKNKNGTPVYPAIRRTLMGVWDTKVVKQNARTTPAPNGAWVYLRED